MEPLVWEFGGADGRRDVLPLVLVDRDGVINVNRPDHVKSWEEFEFLPGAMEGLALLAPRFRVIVVTNQANIGRGLLLRSELEAIHSKMVVDVEANGGRIRAIIACPHRPEDRCGCRKPAPGMLLEASKRFGTSLPEMIFVGDDTSDLEAASRAGCRSILVRSGRAGQLATTTALHEGCIASFMGLHDAAKHLVSRSSSVAVGSGSASE